MKAYIPTIFALLLAASTMPARNSIDIQTSETDSQRPDKVRLYAKDNYSGKTLEFSPEEAQTITLDRKHKNQISSIEVPQGYVVTLIDKGEVATQRQVFRAGRYKVIGGLMDNKADIVVIEPDSSPLPNPGDIFNSPYYYPGAED